MQTSIDLQGLFSYSLWPLLITLFIFLMMTLWLVWKKVKSSIKPKKKEVVQVIPNKNIKNIPAIKKKYIDRLNSIENKYRSEKINLRKAYQQISENVRFFVFEVTDISTQNFSLAEIKKAGIPGLYELIEEYYEPEFAKKSVGDFDDAINKARRIVNEWN